MGGSQEEIFGELTRSGDRSRFSSSSRGPRYNCGSMGMYCSRFLGHARGMSTWWPLVDGRSWRHCATRRCPTSYQDAWRWPCPRARDPQSAVPDVAARAADGRASTARHASRRRRTWASRARIFRKPRRETGVAAITGRIAVKTSPSVSAVFRPALRPEDGRDRRRRQCQVHRRAGHAEDGTDHRQRVSATCAGTHPVPHRRSFFQSSVRPLFSMRYSDSSNLVINSAIFACASVSSRSSGSFRVFNVRARAALKEDSVPALEFVGRDLALARDRIERVAAKERQDEPRLPLGAPPLGQLAGLQGRLGFTARNRELPLLFSHVRPPRLPSSQARRCPKKSGPIQEPPACALKEGWIHARGTDGLLYVSYTVHLDFGV